MSSLVSHSRAVALTYALMGTWCLVAAALMGALALHDYLSWIASAGLILWLLAVLSFRFDALGSTSREITLGISACMTLWRTGDAVWLTLVRVTASETVPAGILLGRWLLASALGVCTYTLWKCWRASNNRWRGP